MPSRFMSKADAAFMAMHYFPDFLRSRRHAMRMHAWMDGRQAELVVNGEGCLAVEPEEREYGGTFQPARAQMERTGEYENLQSLAPNSFASLVVKSLAQTTHIEGIRRPKVIGQLETWNTLRRNNILSRQTAIHRTAIGTGLSFAIVIPGKDPLTGEKTSKILLRSPKRMAAFYDSDDDEWPTLAIDAVPTYGRTDFGTDRQNGWFVELYDEYVVHRLSVKGDGAKIEDWTYIDYEEHDTPVPPVARLANYIDLDGKATGEIEPVLPLLRRIDQDVFDRLIIQRFGAWQVRYIAGMAKPANAQEQKAQALKLSVEDILISTDPDTKIGTLPGGSLSPQIEATDHDLRLLAAITQTPPHHLLGLSSNLQAEALAAAESGLQRKSFDFKANAGEFYESIARLDALQRGDMALATASDIHIRFRDGESRSFTQAADALGKLATQLKVPIEMLWEKIPGWTDDDVERAKDLIADGTFEQMIRELGANPEADAIDDEGSDEKPPVDDADSK